MTSVARITAARLALRLAAQGVAAGNLPAQTLAPSVTGALAAAEADRRAARVTRLDGAIAEARTLVRKSKTARLICGTGDLWNGDDRAHQFALLNRAADLRRLTLRSGAR